MSHSMWDPSFLTRDQTRTPCIGSRVLTTGPQGKFLHITYHIIHRTGGVLSHLKQRNSRHYGIPNVLLHSTVNILIGDMESLKDQKSENCAPFPLLAEVSVLRKLPEIFKVTAQLLTIFIQ